MSNNDHSKLHDLAKLRDKSNLIKTNSVDCKTNNSKHKQSRNSDETKPGFFRKAIPIMPKPLAVLCCIFNIFFPGLGIFCYYLIDLPAWLRKYKN